jgi:hypothetical protein
MRANRTSGSMRGYWGLDTVGLVRHRQTKEAGTDRPDLPSDSQALLYPFLCEDCRLTIVDMDGRRIARVKIEPRPQDTGRKEAARPQDHL